MAVKNKASTESVEKKETKYKKAAILESKTFREYRDVLASQLMEDDEYSISEIQGIIDWFLDREVGK